MSAHTPGPWETEGPHGREVWGRDFTGAFKAITDRVRGGSPEEAQANARLISAAPDLLEALREIAKGEGRYSRDPLEHASNTIEDMQAIAAKAIAKAEGR